MKYKRLGRKKSVNNEQWQDARNTATQKVPKSRILELQQQAILLLKQVKSENKKVAYAWSGGKDSIVLADLCIRAGINDAVLGISKLEYKPFLNWILINKPQNLTIITRNFDLEWLSKNKQFLFPTDNKYNNQFMHKIQRQALNIYVKENKVDSIILGRRKIDGNFVPDIRYVSGGYEKVIPLADWTHEELFAYIEYFNLLMPPIYDWEEGYVLGTHSWNMREIKQGQTIMDKWEEIYNIDEQIVIDASNYFESADFYIKTRKKDKK